MALDLQMTPCDVCKRMYYSSGLNSEVEKKSSFEEQIQEDLQHCSCERQAQLKKDHLYYQNPKINSNNKELNEYVDQDIYFYDLYITYNNFHQDTLTRKAI